MTLRKKLILLMSGMSVLLLALAFGLVRYAVKGHISAEAHEAVDASRVSLEREVNKALQSYQLQGELIANDESLKQTLLKNAPEQAAAHLNNAYQNTPAEYVILLDDKGEVVADVRQQFRRGSRLPISGGLLAPDSGDTGFLYIEGTLLAAAVVQIRHEEHIIGSMIVGTQATPGRIADLETVTRAKITIVLPKAPRPLTSLSDVDAAEMSTHTGNCSPEKLGKIEQAEIGGVPHVIAVEKLADVRGDTLGCFAVSRSMAPQLAAMHHIDQWMLIACLVMAALAGAGAWAISYSIVDRVRRLTRMALQIAAGDLSDADPPDARQDEIGQTARAFHGMLHSLRTLAEAADRMAKGDLTGRIELEGQVADAFNRMLEGQRAVVRQIASASVQLTAAAAAIYTAAQRQESAAADNALGIEHVSLTVESLLGSASHIAESARGVLANAERTKETTDGMSRRITELNGHTNRIAELLEVIREIADRSDLLALNASLEATRAGEAGRAFALVAGEMRRLAERVTASVQDVKSLLSDVRGSGGATVAATNEGRELAESTTESARQITRVTEEQRTATEQMLVSMQGISTVLLEWVAAAQEARASAGVLKQEADRLAGVVGDFQLDDSGRESERGHDGERTRESERARESERESERSHDGQRTRDGERLREGDRGRDSERARESL